MRKIKLRYPRKYSPEDIIIIKKSKMINGKIAVLYVNKDQPDLKRIKIEDDEK